MSDYCPLVAYYRDRLSGKRPNIPGWRRYYGPIGVGYQHEEDGYVLDATMAEQLHRDGKLSA